MFVNYENAARVSTLSSARAYARVLLCYVSSCVWVNISVHGRKVAPEVKLAPRCVLRHQPRVNQRAKLFTVPVNRPRPRRVVQKGSFDGLTSTARLGGPAFEVPKGFGVAAHDKIPGAMGVCKHEAECEHRMRQ
jgi:hypothetical protein